MSLGIYLDCQSSQRYHILQTFKAWCFPLCRVWSNPHLYSQQSKIYIFKKHLKTISYNTFLCPAILEFLVSWSVTLPVVNRHPIWSLIDILEQFDIPNPERSKYSHLLVLRHFIKSQTHWSHI